MTLERTGREISKCARCGSCRSVCPLLSIDHSEAAVARGKVEVIKKVREGSLGASDDIYGSFLDNCLLCGRCEVKCPNKVNTFDLFTWERNMVARGKGIPREKKALLAGLSLSPPLGRGAARLGKGIISLLAARVPTSSGLYYRIPSWFGKEDRYVPEIPSQSFLHSHGKGGRSLPENGSSLLFAGCVYNYLFPEVLERVCSSHPASIEVPVEQECCGLPALASGDMEGAAERAMRNISLFSHLDREKVVFPCASCLYMVKEVYPRLVEGTEVYREALLLSDRCIDYESYILGERGGNLKGDVFYSDSKVSYHIPCHSLSVPGAVESSEKLLRVLLGDRYLPMKGAELCCGFGGTFNITHHDKSVRMGLRKIALAEESGTQVIATSCSGCLLHIRESVARAGSSIKVVHVGDIIGN